MSNLKGKFAAIKMKYLIFVSAAALLVSLPTRVYQLLAVVDPINGFYNGNDITIAVLYGVVGVFAVLFLILSFLSKEVPSPKLPVGKNPILGVSSIIMAAGLGWDLFSIESKVVPQVEGGFNMEMFGSLLSSNLAQNGGAILVLRFIFAIFAIFYFLIFAVSHLNGKASYKEYKILAITPVCWATTVLISRLMTAVSFIRVSELLFEIFTFVFGMLFLLTFARISSGVFTEDSMWGIYGYGFSAALFAGLITIPRIVCAISGLPYVEGYEFNFVHLAFMIFVISYIVASLGVGFKDGFKNMRTIAEVELPDDEDVVVKYSKKTPADIVLPDFNDGVSLEDDEAENDSGDISLSSENNTADEAEFMYELEADDEKPSEEVPEVAAETEIQEQEEILEEAEAVAEEPSVIEQSFEDVNTSFEEPVAEASEVYEAPADITEEVFSAEETEASEDINGDEKEVEKPKAKKEKKSLFGVKKAPEQEELTADDLKPISLADLKKNKKD